MWIYLLLCGSLGFLWVLSLWSSPHNEGALAMMKFLLAPVVYAVGHCPASVSTSQPVYVFIAVLAFVWSYSIGLLFSLLVCFSKNEA